MRPNRILAVLVVAGTALGLVSSVPWGLAAALSVSAGSCAVVVGAGRVRLFALGCIVAAGSAAYGARARDKALLPPLVSWFASEQRRNGPPGAIDVEGTIATDAERLEDGARLLIDVTRIRGAAGWWPVTGRIQVHVAGQFAGDVVQEWTGGRPIRTAIMLRTPPVWLNPGGSSERWQTLTRRFDLSGTIKSALLVRVLPARPWDAAAAGVRAAVRRGVARRFGSYPPRVGAIVTAVLIGDRIGLDEELEDRLQRAGTYHVIAISGGNVALLTAGVFLCLRLLIRSFERLAISTLAVVLAYGWVVGHEPSVARAVTAAALYLVCGAFGLWPGALDVLALVALCLAIVDPLVVLNGGAWLTFGATLGSWWPAVVGHPSRLPHRRRGLPGSGEWRWNSRARRLLRNWLCCQSAHGCSCA